MRRILPALLASAALLLSPAHAQEAASAPSQDVPDRNPVAVDLPDETPKDVASLATSGAPVTALPDALRLAYWTTPSLLAQRASVRGIDYRVAQARAGYGPKLDYQLVYGYQRDTFDQRIGNSITAHGFSSTATAILTQPLFTFGRLFAQERQAVAQVGFQRQVLRSTEQQAMLDAITAYVGLMRDRASVAIAKDNLETLERELSDNRARFNAHEVTVTDIQQVITRVELARAQVYVAQRDAASSEATFVRMIGAPAGTLAAPNPLELPVTTLEDAYIYAENHNPILLAAQQREHASRAAVDSTKADLMPRVDLRGTAEVGTQSPYTNALRQYDTRAEVIVSGPIFESGLRQSRVGEAKAANDADWRLIDSALRETRATLASSWNDWKAQQASIDRYAAAVDSAQKAYDGATLQERAGLVTTLDVLELARELLAARSNYNSSIAATYIAQARVLASVGALEQAWLLPDDPRYDPEDNYRHVRHRGDVPLLTPLVRALDGLTYGPNDDRPLRDPATTIVTPSVKIAASPAASATLP